jgi:hypothetical protein
MNERADEMLIREALALTRHMQSRGLTPRDAVKVLGLVLSGMLLNKETTEAFIKTLRTTCKIRRKRIQKEETQ